MPGPTGPRGLIGPIGLMGPPGLDAEDIEPVFYLFGEPNRSKD